MLYLYVMLFMLLYYVMSFVLLYTERTIPFYEYHITIHLIEPIFETEGIGKHVYIVPSLKNLK